MTTHSGGCHCGNLRLTLRLSQSPEETKTRACGCSFCRANQTKTTSDPNGSVDIWAKDWSQVERYRFGTATADFLICKRCGIYIGAAAETESGWCSVTNLNSLDDRALFVNPPTPTVHDGETVESRIARRAANWTPTVFHM
jgi:hypothetical protein